MDYRVDYGTLEQQGARAQGVADQMPAVVAPMRLDRVAAAIPGSLSAGRASAADAKMVTGGQALTQITESYAAALTVTAESYRAIEETSEGVIEKFFGAVS